MPGGKKISGVRLEWLCSLPAGKHFFVAPNWGNDDMRRAARRAAHKGYFFKVRRYDTRCEHHGFGDHFIRTEKPMVHGDSIRKPLSYSWPDLTMCPPVIRALIEQQQVAEANAFLNP